MSDFEFRTIKTTVESYRKKFIDYSGRWARKELWEFYNLVNDAWLAGYRTGVEDAAIVVTNSANVLEDNKAKMIAEVTNTGKDLVEIETTPAQFGMAYKYSKLTAEEIFINTMKSSFQCNDIKVAKDKAGNITFQGTLGSFEKR